MSKNKDPRSNFPVKSKKIKLSDRDLEKLIEVCKNSPAPNERLKEAVKKYFENEQNDDK